MAKRPVPKYDFKAFGAAIKAARTGRKESRKKVSDEMFISPRYLANIENKGQHPICKLVPVLSLSRKKSGKPNRRAAAKHTICRLVRLKATFVLTLDKSLGTGTYAK